MNKHLLPPYIRRLTRYLWSYVASSAEGPQHVEPSCTLVCMDSKLLHEKVEFKTWCIRSLQFVGDSQALRLQTGVRS